MERKNQVTVAPAFAHGRPGKLELQAKPCSSSARDKMKSSCAGLARVSTSPFRVLRGVGAHGSSGMSLTFGTRSYSGHAGENGHPELAPGLNRGQPLPSPPPLDPRFRGGDEKEKIGTICSDRTTSLRAEGPRAKPAKTKRGSRRLHFFAPKTCPDSPAFARE